MAGTKTRASSFSRNVLGANSPQIPGLKHDPNGTMFISSGIPDLDIVTFPPTLLSPSSSTRWQHMADTLLSVKAIPDEDKELEPLLTGYQDMVPVILEATTFSIKLQKRRYLVLECLYHTPIDGSSGSSYGTSGSRSGSSKTGLLIFVPDFVIEENSGRGRHGQG
ncbi:hypothetical protein M0R45_004868 [Rubus argutus]|uniref:Uncharacterized protein n=1 Tax=Rubus argutus TaxID=59490 RepID=A0AAW1YL00_RUBAR